MFVLKRDGTEEPIHFDKITKRINKLVTGDEKKFIQPILIAQKVVGNIVPGITTEELDNLSADVCINMCTTHPSYALLAGKILVSNLHKKTLNSFVEKQELIQENLKFLDESYLNWIKENREAINAMVVYDRDYLFDYFGFKTLERAYLIKVNNKIVERPQDMFMRVASFIGKGNLELIKKTYDLMSVGYYTHASPTLFNSGNVRAQQSSCYLLGSSDSMDGITKTWADVAKISKWGGGIGLHISNIRAKDSLIRGTNGPSSGIIPMLKVYNEIARYVDQCFVGSTKVYTEKGLISIEEIKPNDKVFTIDGSLQEVERIYCDKYEGKILNLKIIHDYESIKVTDSHPFYVIKNQQLGTNFSVILNRLDKKLIHPEWISAKDITNNDLIGFPIPKYTIDNKNLDEADCYFYGLMIGDGHICKDRNESGITLGFKKADIIEFTKKYLSQNGIHYWENITESTHQFRWTTNSKFKFVRSQLYDSNNEKHFDESLLHLPEDKVKWIVKGVLDTDGCINKEITLEMSSQNIIDSIKYILLKMGILCSGYSRDRIGNISSYKNIETTKLTWVLRIPKVAKIAKLLNIEEGQFFKYFVYDNIVYTRLKEVSEETIETCVYDLEIKNNHNYLTQAGLVHNGGKRKGSVAIYLEPHHSDIMPFLELRKNFGAETERARDLFLAVWVSDLFMKQVEADADWYLMCPDKCPGLTDAYGEAYEKLYWSYVEQNRYNKKIKARDVMKAILDSQLETGTPYIGFKDHINNKSNQKNIGTIKSSNLCVHENTVILTDQGNKNIKSLKDSEVNVWNGYEWSKVTVKQTGSNQDLIRVSLSNGSFLDCTPEHKFYIIEDLRIARTRAMNLNVNDRLIEFKMPNGLKIENVYVTSVEESFKNVDTYCFTEPLRNMGVFNGILTGQCHEIVEYSDENEYAVCNLASIALNKCVVPFKNTKKWKIYTKDDCKYCKWAKAYLTNTIHKFEEEMVDSDKLKEITGLEKPTYPQIYYGTKLIGGYTELYNFIKGTFDYDKLYDIAYTATVNLNNIIDNNYYPVIEAKRSNIRHRPIAVGIQGLADALVLLKIQFDSDESVEFNAKFMETIYLGCLTASMDISKSRYEDLMLMEKFPDLPEYYDQNFYIKDEKLNEIYHKHKLNKCELVYERDKHIGAYSTFQGSPISEGKFQFDLWSFNRNKLFHKEKWLKLEEEIKVYGVRNSLVTALMPTASTSQILGNNECFEYFTNNIYTRRTLAGDFPLVNKYLINDLNNIGLWNNEMKQLIIANNGSIANFNNIPDGIRNLYKTIWEIKQIWVLKNALARSPFVDQTQSMNIWMSVPDYQKLFSSHFWAWKNGLKTGIYYLRSKAAKDATKITIDPTIEKKLKEIIENDNHEVCESCSG